MTNNQMFVALLAVMLTLFSAFYKLLKDYMDAKIDPIYKVIDAKLEPLNTMLERLDKRDESLNAYVIDHAERLAKLEPKSK